MTNILQESSNTTKKQLVAISYFTGEVWTTQEKELLLSQNKAKSIQHVLTYLLAVVSEEKIIHKKTEIQSCILDASEILYVSFTRNPLLKQSSLFEKWMFIESLLKTVSLLKLLPDPISIKAVHFLVDHQPLQDTQLDFSKSWPIDGYMNLQ